MKRTLCLLLIVFLSLPLNISADAEKTDISFNGIPWGSSIKDTIALLKQKYGDEIQYTKTDIEYSTLSQNLQARQYLKTTYGSLGPYIMISVMIPNLKVAGYDVKHYSVCSESGPLGTKNYAGFDPFDNVFLFFSPILSEDGNRYSFNEGKLFSAAYAGFVPLEDGWAEDMNGELIEKLHELYQSASFETKTELNALSPNNDQYIWSTDSASVIYTIHNGTKTGVMGNESTIELTGYLVYFSNEGRNDYQRIYEIMNQISSEKEVQDKEQEQKDKENRGTDGL